eukprot:6069739-Pleurochrysis_carterae.AAC.2
MKYPNYGMGASAITGFMCACTVQAVPETGYSGVCRLSLALSYSSLSQMPTAGQPATMVAAACSCHVRGDWRWHADIRGKRSSNRVTELSLPTAWTDGYIVGKESADNKSKRNVPESPKDFHRGRRSTNAEIGLGDAAGEKQLRIKAAAAIDAATRSSTCSIPAPCAAEAASSVPHVQCSRLGSNTVIPTDSEQHPYELEPGHTWVILRSFVSESERDLLLQKALHHFKRSELQQNPAGPARFFAKAVESFIKSKQGCGCSWLDSSFASCCHFSFADTIAEVRERFTAFDSKDRDPLGIFHTALPFAELCAGGRSSAHLPQSTTAETNRSI